MFTTVSIRTSRRNIAACILAAMLTPGALSDVIHVPSNDAPDIQTGIELAEDGDTVLVGPGVYHEAIDFLGKTIIVESSDGAAATIIDAFGLDTSVVTVTSGEGTGTELRGFTIRGGIGTLVPEAISAGRTREASPLKLAVHTRDGSSRSGASGGYRIGGGVLVLQSALLLEDCIVTDNHVPSEDGAGGGFLVSQPQDVLLRNSIIEGNSAHLGGGGLVSLGSMQIMSCTLRNNLAVQGGGLNINNNASAEVSSSVFEANTAEGGSDLFWEQGAGAMVMFNSTASFIECQFLENAAGGRGGGLVVRGNTTVDQCTFQGNTARSGGGIINFGILAVDASQFIENHAAGGATFSGGGGVNVVGSAGDPGTVTTLHNSTFIGNTASGGEVGAIGGGAAHLTNDATVVNCTFESNSSASRGGAMQLSSSTSGQIIVDGCNFTENEADDLGGAVVMVNSSSNKTAPLSLTNCHFQDNQAHRGGAFAKTGLTNGSVVENCTFVDNRASLEGGAKAYYVVSSDHSPLHDIVRNCQLISNEADVESGSGGGLSLRGDGRVDFIQCTFEENSAWLGGGAIILEAGSQPWPPSRFIDCTFATNAALQGGAIDVNIRGSALISECSFTSNIAANFGGAVMVLSSGFAEVHTSHFDSNQADFGGAISAHSESVSGIMSCSFVGNTAATDGGAIYGPQSYTAWHCEFANNIAGGRGGAIATQGNPAIHGGTFKENVAGESGGAVFNESDQGAEFHGIFACANSPENIAGPYEDFGNNVIDEVCESGIVIHVPQEYATIQEAIDAAASGDEIVIAPGTYDESIDYSGKRLVIRSSDGPEVTIIDATGLGSTVVTVESNESIGTTLRGLTIRGGQSADGGGGVRINGALLLVDDCIITQNSATIGGGLDVGENSSTFTEVTVINSRITNNQASSLGGAARVSGRLYLIDTVLEGNHSSIFAGAVMVANHGLVTSNGCEFRDNSAGNIGGAVSFAADGVFRSVDSLFCGNTPDHVSNIFDVPWTGDVGGNEFLDDCPGEAVVGDLNGDDVVDVSDLLILLGAWGRCGGGDCPADLSGDRAVDVSDLLILLGNWG